MRRRCMPACTNEPHCADSLYEIVTSSHRSACNVPGPGSRDQHASHDTDSMKHSPNSHDIPTKQSIARSQSVQRHISSVAVCRAILSSEIVHFRQPSTKILTIFVSGGTVKVQPVQARKCKVGRDGRSSCFSVITAHARKY